MAQRWIFGLSRGSLLSILALTVGCAGIGTGRKSADNFKGVAPIGSPHVQPFNRPFPNFQGSRTPDATGPRIIKNIALANYQSDEDVIELPLPAEDGMPTIVSESTGEAIVDLPLPGEGAVGESCGPSGCATGSCANGNCSTDGLNIQGAPGCAPYPPEYAHHGKHAALAAEKDTMRSMGIKGRHNRWYMSWKADPTPDIGFNNPCFPRELRMKSHPQYLVEPPDILYIEVLTVLPNRPLLGERLIRQDGTISLGYYGQIHVAGLTLVEVENKIRQHLKQYVENPQVYVDVASFNSKVYYVLGQVQQQGRLPITGRETVLDAITLAGGLTNFADYSKIHVARPNPGGGCDQILWVDYKALAFAGDTRTNYQLLPGDRVVVPATCGFGTTRLMDNYLTPFERVASIFALLRFAFINNNNHN